MDITQTGRFKDRDLLILEILKKIAPSLKMRNLDYRSICLIGLSKPWAKSSHSDKKIVVEAIEVARDRFGVRAELEVRDGNRNRFTGMLYKCDITNEAKAALEEKQSEPSCVMICGETRKAVVKAIQEKGEATIVEISELTGISEGRIMNCLGEISAVMQRRTVPVAAEDGRVRKVRAYSLSSEYRFVFGGKDGDGANESRADLRAAV